MHYILELLPVFPILLAVSVALYALAYVFFAKKREKPRLPVLLAEFVLAGWFVVFVYVTQVKSFGNGMGDLYNLRPLRMFFIAFRYGSNNAQMVWQFLLNILMFVPLGLLLPIVFPRKCRSWPRVALISFCVTLATELLQLATQRGADIDDVIANTVGGLCGFALFLVGYALFHVMTRRPITVPHFTRKLIGGACVVAAVIGVFVAVKCADGSSPYGNFYYGNLQPTAVTISDDVDDKESVRGVYRYVERVSTEELQRRLQAYTGFNGDYTQEDGGVYALADGDNRVFIYPYNTWCVMYEYGVSRDTDPARIPAEDEALALAWACLDRFGISTDDIRYDRDVSDTYMDGDRHLQFVALENGDATRVHGAITVTLGEDGLISEVRDSRLWCEFVKEVACISPRQAVGIAQDVGVGEWRGTANVAAVDADWSFIEETGYLIPVWKVQASVLSDDGEIYDWSPVMDAVK